MNNPVQKINQLECGVDDIMFTKNNEFGNDGKILKMLRIKSKLEEVTNMKNKINEQQNKFIDNEDVINILDERTKNITVFGIKRLTNKQIEEIYTINNEKVELLIETDSEERKISFMRDFLIFKKESSVALKQIDDSMEKLEKELKENEKQLNKIIEECGDINSLIKNRLINNINNSANENIKKRNTEILKNFNDALTLNIIFEHYRNQNILNTLHDYKMRSEAIYKNYVKTCKQLGIKSDITVFDGLEKFLPEKYHTYPNLFLFSIIKYFAYKKNNCDKHIEGIFLSQFLVNVQNLFCDKFKDKGEKQIFIEAIMKVLDLFYS